MASAKNLTGVATIDLGLGAGDQLKNQMEDEVNARKKKALQAQQQSQMFPSVGMLFGAGQSTSGLSF